MREEGVETKPPRGSPSLSGGFGVLDLPERTDSNGNKEIVACGGSLKARTNRRSFLREAHVNPRISEDYGEIP
jgi:hypothetical protein